MTVQLQDARQVDADLEDFVAELTVAAYPVALRHGMGTEWLNLELDLWEVLTETVKKWGQRALLTTHHSQLTTNQ